MAFSTLHIIDVVVQKISYTDRHALDGRSDDLLRLRDSLLRFHDLLSRADVTRVESEPVKRWLHKLDNLVYEADDMMDELRYESRYELKNERYKRAISVISDLIVSYDFVFHYIRMIFDNIQEINKNLDKSLAVLKKLLDKSPVPLSREISTPSFLNNDYVVGRDDDVSSIVKMLSGLEVRDDIEVFSIVGIGGAGKTVLAQLVFNDVEIMHRFHEKIWVSVPNQFDIQILLKMILDSSGGEHLDVQNTPDTVLLEKFHEHFRKLQGQYLIVLDGIWDLDDLKWKDFTTILRKCQIRLVIVVTTRSKKVAAIVGTLPTHHLQMLSEQDCLSIIKAVAFKGSQSIPMEFETIEKSLAERCQGLPLAAISIGITLLKEAKSNWPSALGTPRSNWREDDVVMKSLKLSFDRLPSSSDKKCFAYCSNFQKGRSIERKQLIELWMAEGFLGLDPSKSEMDKKGNSIFKFLNLPSFNKMSFQFFKGLTTKRKQLMELWMAERAERFQSKGEMEKEGNRIFNHLIESSLLEVVELDDYDNIKSCKMHAMAHDLACFVSNSERIRTEDGDSVNMIVPHTIVVHLASSGPYEISYETWSQLRTFFFNGKVTNIIFSYCERLHVLNLMYADIEELPNKIGNLIQLRYLDISYTGIKLLPKSIGKLYLLQTLRLIGMRCFKKLPSTLKNLISLRHLHISSIELPSGIENLISLRSLPYYKVDPSIGHQIGVLRRLTNLEGELEIQNLEWVKDTAEAKCADLFERPNISELRFVWDDSRESGPNDESVLEGLIPHPNLKGLEIRGYMGRKFPFWAMNMGCKNSCYLYLKNLRLKNCWQCELVPILGDFPNLKSLHLIGLTNVRSIGIQFYGNGDRKFQSLARLEMSGMPNLTRWFEPEDAEPVFPCLEYLKIEECNQLTDLPNCLSLCQNLEIYRDIGMPIISVSKILEPALGLAKGDDGNNNKHGKSLSQNPLSASTSKFGSDQMLASADEVSRKASSPVAEIVELHDELKSTGEIEEEFVTPEERETTSSGQQVTEFTNMPDFILDNCAENESGTPSGIHMIEAATSYPTHGEIENDTDVEQTKLEGSSENLGLITSTSTSTDNLQSLDYDSITITISATGELCDYADLDLKVLHASLRVVHDLSYLDYWFVVKTRTHQNIGPISISKAALLPHELARVVPREHLIYKDGSGPMKLPTEGEWSQAYVVSLMEMDHLFSLNDEPNSPNLVALFLQGLNRLSDITSSFFDSMPALRFLDLSDVKIRTLPTSLFKLTKLQVLLLKNCVRLVTLPAEIEQLHHIEVLDLSGTELYSLPKQVGQLTRLKELQLSFFGPDDESEYAHLPSELISSGSLSKLQYLRGLSIFVHPEDQRWRKMAGELTQDIASMRRLKHLQFYFPSLDDLHIFVEQSPSWNKNPLSTFNFVVGHDVERIGSRVRDGAKSKYHQQARRLRFVNGDGLPQVIKDVLKRATAFCLDHHLKAQSLSQFEISNIRELKSCVVRECPNIKVIVGDIEKNEALLSNLEYLGLHYLWKLQHIWNSVDLTKGSFNALKHLAVYTCHQIKFILPVLILPYLSSLEEIVVEDCEAVTEISKGKMKTVVKNNVLPNLRNIVLRNLPRLVSLGNGLCLTEEKINVSSCPNFKPNVKVAE